MRKPVKLRVPTFNNLRARYNHKKVKQAEIIGICADTITGVETGNRTLSEYVVNKTLAAYPMSESEEAEFRSLINGKSNFRSYSRSNMSSEKGTVKPFYNNPDKDEVSKNPFVLAKNILGGRFKMTQKEYFLDGRSVVPSMVIKEANLLLRKKGWPQIEYPGLYRKDYR